MIYALLSALVIEPYNEPYHHIDPPYLTRLAPSRPKARKTTRLPMPPVVSNGWPKLAENYARNHTSCSPFGTILALVSMCFPSKERDNQIMKKVKIDGWIDGLID